MAEEKVVTRGLPHDFGFKHCDGHLHNGTDSCLPALVAGGLWNLLHTEPPSLCPLPKRHLPSPVQTSHLIMQPLLPLQVLERSSCPGPCVQACPDGCMCPWEQETMLLLCQCLSSLTSRKFILVSDPISLSAAEAKFAHHFPQILAPVCKLILLPPL